MRSVRDEVAAALDKALTMSRTERITRYNDMMAVLRKQDISHWRETFLHDLNALPARGDDHGTANKVATFQKLA